MPLEIRKCLVCSTSHVDRGTAERMDGNTVNSNDSDCSSVIYSHFEYGWMVRWWPKKRDRDAEWDKALPKCLRDVFDAAEKAGCDMVQFDNSGPTIDGLATFDW